jgi:hypothetical protein
MDQLQSLDGAVLLRGILVSLRKCLMVLDLTFYRTVFFNIYGILFCGGIFWREKEVCCAVCQGATWFSD